MDMSLGGKKQTIFCLHSSIKQLKFIFLYIHNFEPIDVLTYWTLMFCWDSLFFRFEVLDYINLVFEECNITQGSYGLIMKHVIKFFVFLSYWKEQGLIKLTGIQI